MRRYLDAGIVTPAQAMLVGYPKLDALVNGQFDAREVRRSLGLDPDRPTALFGPTWSLASALHVAGEAIVESLIGAGFNVIAKLHDRSLQTSERFTDGIDWRARLSRFTASGAFALATGADSSPYLAAADLMVTDHSSIGFEYLTLDRPLIVFDTPDLAQTARINPEKIALLRSAATVVRDTRELADAALDSRRSPGTLSAQRRHIASDMFFRAGTATERALDACYGLLHLRRPRDARRPHASTIADDQTLFNTSSVSNVSNMSNASNDPNDSNGPNDSTDIEATV
jgi:CDP-glycerol glycerophosphotransferase